MTYGNRPCFVCKTTFDNNDIINVRKIIMPYIECVRNSMEGAINIKSSIGNELDF